MYNCISSPIVIDAQFTELNNEIKINIKILLHIERTVLLKCLKIYVDPDLKIILLD